MLTETKVIDYNQQVNFVTVHECFISSVLTALENLKHLRNVETNLLLPFNYYFKPAEECIKTKTWYSYLLLYYQYTTIIPIYNNLFAFL